MQADSIRDIIIHFHLFKNAGTSIDVNLRRIFGDQFLDLELGGPIDLFPASHLVRLLERNPGIRAISSHTLTLPIPSRDGWRILPIIFLRHPVDRILSIYTYERGQDSDTPGALMAKKWDFPEYVEARLNMPEDIVLRNWQTGWLACDRLVKSNYSTDDEVLFDTASVVLKGLPFIGVVERFKDSLQLLNRVVYDRAIPAVFQMEKKNRSSIGTNSLTERLDLVRSMIGNDLYQRLEQANALDLRLHQLAFEMLAARLAGRPCDQVHRY